MTAILSIQQVDGVQGCTTARKEIDDKGIGLVGNKEANGIMNGIEGLGEIEFPTANYRRKFPSNR